MMVCPAVLPRLRPKAVELSQSFCGLVSPLTTHNRKLPVKTALPLSIVIGKALMLSPPFPPLHTVHATFTAHGVPSVSIFHCLNNQPLNRIKTVVVEIRLNRLHGSQLTKVVNLYKLFVI